MNMALKLTVYCKNSTLNINLTPNPKFEIQIFAKPNLTFHAETKFFNLNLKHILIIAINLT